MKTSLLILITVILLSSCSTIFRSGNYRVKTESEGVATFTGVRGKYKIDGVHKRQRVRILVTRKKEKVNVFLITKL